MTDLHSHLPLDYLKVDRLQHLNEQHHQLQIKSKLVAFQGTWTHVETSTAAPAPPVEGVEIDKIADYNGKSLLELDLESLEDKPWRKPGTLSL